MSILFAASYPDRASELILFGTGVKGTRSENYPWALTEEQHKFWQEDIRAKWGGAYALENFAPSLADDKDFAQSWARLLRQG